MKRRRGRKPKKKPTAEKKKETEATAIEEEEEEQEDDERDEDYKGTKEKNKAVAEKEKEEEEEEEEDEEEEIQLSEQKKQKTTEEENGDDDDEEEEEETESEVEEKTLFGRERKEIKVPTKTRRSYSVEENQAMLDWLEKHAANCQMNVFKAMAIQRVTSHSWKSMRNHYHNKLEPLLRTSPPKNSATNNSSTLMITPKVEVKTETKLKAKQREEEQQHWQNWALMINDIDRFAQTVSEPPKTPSPAPQNALATTTTTTTEAVAVAVATASRKQQIDFSGILNSPARGVVKSVISIEREAFVRKLVGDLMLKFNRPLQVVLLALVVNNGDSKKAEKYLECNQENEGIMDAPWSLEEDKLVLANDRESCQEIIKRRGREAFLARAYYLAETTPSANI